MKRIKLNGAVFSGGGTGKEFLCLPWVKRQIKQKLGFAPYLGTLNVLLSEESVKRRKLLQEGHSMKILPAEGYCNGLLFKALIGTLECGIVVPEIAGYSKKLLEIIAPFNLREMLHLQDGDEVTVTVSL